MSSCLVKEEEEEEEEEVRRERRRWRPQHEKRAACVLVKLRRSAADRSQPYLMEEEGPTGYSVPFWSLEKMILS